MRDPSPHATGGSGDGHTGTHQKALAVNLDPTNFGAFAEIGAGQEVARWFLRVGAASGTVAKTVSAYDKGVSDDLYGSGTRYVSRPRLETMLDREWTSLVQQVGDARGKDTRLFVFADTIAARNFAGTNDCHGWIGVRFQDRPKAEASDILLHVNLRDNANVLQQEAVGVLGVNLLHALLIERGSPGDLATRMFDNLAGDRVEIDQIVMEGGAFAGCDMRELHTALARNGQAEAITFDVDGEAMAANEFLYRKSLAIVPSAIDGRDGLSSEAIAAGLGMLRREVSKDREVKDVVAVRLTVIDSEAARPEAGKGEAMITRHRPLYLTTAFLRRYTQAPLCFLAPLPTLMRIFDEVRYQDLEGRLLEGVARLFGANVRVLVYPCPRDEVLRLIDTEVGQGWEVDGGEQSITADLVRPAPPLRHLYEYLLGSGFLVSMPADS